MTKDLEVHKGDEALAPALVAAGVKLEEAGGFRTVVFPPNLRERFNVLLPAQEVAQAVALIRPSIRVCQLDPDPDGIHFYNQGTEKEPRLAPTKQALETLGFTAGITLARTRPMRREELEPYDGEMGKRAFGYEATVTIRRPDGTPLEISRSKIWQPDVEYRKVVARRPGWANTEEKWAAEREKRWLAEREFGPAKTESKAVLRAIRAALQIPHVYTPAQAAKPFVVVGYDLALDYTNPEIVRLLLERKPALEEEVYGEVPAVGPAGARDDAAAAASPPPEQASQAVEEPAAPLGFTGEEPPEPELDPEPDDFAPVNVELGDIFTRYAGQTVADVAAAGDRGYLEWLASDAVEDERIRHAAERALDGLDERAS